MLDDLRDVMREALVLAVNTFAICFSALMALWLSLLLFSWLCHLILGHPLILEG